MAVILWLGIKKEVKLVTHKPCHFVLFIVENWQNQVNYSVVILQ
jgi:hypothetical protein